MCIKKVQLARADITLIASSLLNSGYSRHNISESGLRHLSPSTAAELFIALPQAERSSFIEAVLNFFCLEQTHINPEQQADFLEFTDLVFTSWEHSNQLLCFHTSGSTGKPAAHIYSLHVLEAEAKAIAEQFTCRKRVISVMPLHHIFGFVFSVLLPKVLGVPILYFPPLPLASFCNSLSKGDLVLAFPIFWQSLLALMEPETPSCRLPCDIYGVSSTAPCRIEVIEGLLRLPAPLGRMTEIYGSTETSGIGFRHDCHRPYTLLPVWEKSLRTAEAHILRIVPTEPDQLPQAMPDDINWIDPQHFYPLSRKDKAVQVGGINVFPDQVAACIKKHPEVLDCVVRLMQPNEGVRLKAFIVPRSSDNPENIRKIFGKSFRHWLAEQLPPAARPKSITFGAALPRNSMGKLADWPIHH